MSATSLDSDSIDSCSVRAAGNFEAIHPSWLALATDVHPSTDTPSRIATANCPAGRHHKGMRSARIATKSHG